MLSIYLKKYNYITLAITNPAPKLQYLRIQEGATYLPR